MTIPPERPSLAFGRMTARRQVPAIFRNAPTFRAIWRSEATTPGGLDDVREDIVQTQAEQFVRHVSGREEPGMTWRLSWIEEEMGLPNGSLTGLDDDARRDRICARLRSWRLPTAETIHLVAITYYQDVQIYMDYEAYHITIQFPALPPNLEDMEAEIIRILPAHLGVTWLLVPLVWGDPYYQGNTWQQLYDEPGMTWETLLNGGRTVLPPPP